MWSSPSIIVPVLTYLEFSVMSVLTSRWLLSFRQLATSVWNDSQTLQTGYTTDPSNTSRPATTIDTVTRSFGFSARITTAQEHMELEQVGQYLQTSGDERVHRWPE